MANPSFSLRDINLTLGLLPPIRHVVWRDSVGVESSRLRFTSECKDIQSFLWLLRLTDEPHKGRNSLLWLHYSVLSSFGVVLVSCKVNFPVVRSALLPPQGTRGGTPNFLHVKKKYRIVVPLVCENFLDLMKLGAHGGPG